jgi:hypothetical protein
MLTIKHTALVLRPFILRLFALAPLTSLRFLIFAHFRFKALSLAYLHLFTFFLMGISFLIYVFFIRAPFPSTQLQHITCFVCTGIWKSQSSGQIFKRKLYSGTKAKVWVVGWKILHIIMEKR